MTTKFSKEFGNIICFRENQIINDIIHNNQNITFDYIKIRFDKLIMYCKEFIDYIYNYRYNISDIDNTFINFSTNINDEFIINNTTYFQHMSFLIFSYFRDNNFVLTEKMIENIIDCFKSMLKNTI